MGAFDDIPFVSGKAKGKGTFDDLPMAGGPSSGGVQDWEPQGYSGTQMAARKVGLAAQGVNDGFLPTVIGGPVDAAAWALRQIGIGQPAPTLSGLITGETPKPLEPFGGSKSIKRGIDYLATAPGRVYDAVAQGSTAPLTDDRTSRIEPVTTGERTAYGAGEGVGNALAVAVPAGLVAQGARAGTATQGVANVLASQPVAQAIAGGVGGGVTGATDNPLYGLAASLAVPVAASVGRGIISPTTNALSRQEQNIIAAAGREGIDLTPAQMTGSRGLRGAEAAMSNLPLSAGTMQNRFTTQRQQLNSAVLGRANITATDAAPDTLETAFRNIGQTFDDLGRRTTVTADPQFAADLNRVATDYGRRLETNVAPIFRSYMDDIQPLMQAATTPGANPQITGEVYARIRSDIGRTARESNNPALRRALNGLMESFDDALERSTSGALRQEWQDARRNYAVMTIIDKAMQGGTQADRQAGNIPLAALRQAVKGADTTGYSRGRGELNELSRIADYLSNKIPDSGTVPRAAWANLLTLGGLFGAGASAGMSLPVAAVGAATPWLAAQAYNSPVGRNYLTNQLAGNTNFRALYGSTAAQQALSGDDGRQNMLRLRDGQ